MHNVLLVAALVLWMMKAQETWNNLSKAFHAGLTPAILSENAAGVKRASNLTIPL
jgi:hypothetical protein